MQSFSGEMDQFYFTLKGKHRSPVPTPTTDIYGNEHRIIKYVFVFFSLSP